MPASLAPLRSPDPIESTWNLRPIAMPEWIETWSAVAALRMLHARSAEGVNFARGFALDQLVGVRYATGCQMFCHGSEEISRSGGVISIQRLVSGLSAVECGECNYVHCPGTLVILDGLQPYRGSQHDAVIEEIMVPRTSLDLVDATSFAPIFITGDSERGKNLTALMHAFFDAAASQLAFDCRRMITFLKQILTDTWSPGSDREEWWRGRRKLIHKYIDTHLDDPNLGPLQICDLFNMSRATLYRMFEQDGGVRRFIQDRRLHSAMWDLAIGGVRRGRLSRVAERWGFSSDANFNRAVKLAFGKPPGALFHQSVHADVSACERAIADGPFFHWFNVQKNGAPVALVTTLAHDGLV